MAAIVTGESRGIGRRSKGSIAFNSFPKMEIVKYHKEYIIQMAQKQRLAKDLKKTHILIIEDSYATTKKMEEYLKKLGYKNIHVCLTGQNGTKKFDEIIKSNNLPLVFLDYYLPGADALSIFTHLLKTNNETKIVIETAADPSTEPGLKYLIQQGVYHYLKKPITLRKLEGIMKTFECEQLALEPTP